MIVLESTSQKLELETGAAVSTDVICNYVDHTASGGSLGAQETNIATATTTDILAAPGASTKRQVTSVTVRNRSTTTAQTVTVKKDESGTEYHETGQYTLAPGEVMVIDARKRIAFYDAAGREKTANPLETAAGRNFEFLSIGSASEAAGVRYGFAKDSGMPGAWVPGSPGINGWWTDASALNNAANPAGARQTGSPQLQNAALAWYLTRIGLATSVAHAMQLLDLIWYNTGIAVTTTGAQSISQPGASKPARDTYGTTNGHGWMAGIYVTTATTNASPVTNTTLNYTNSEGTAGRTGTIASFPATAVAGTFVPFQLAAGDRGIRSIEGVTLGTSYAAGAVSLVMYRLLSFIPNTVANVGAGAGALKRAVRIWNGTAFWWTYISSATTATSFQAGLELEDR